MLNNWLKYAFFTLLLSSFFLVSAPQADAATFVVNTKGDPFLANCLHIGPCSLRGAVKRANNLSTADEVILGTGVYNLTKTTGYADPDSYDLDVLPNGKLTIRGQGAGVTVIDANLLSRVIEVYADAELELIDLTVTGGSSIQNGGGILNYGNLTLTRVEVLGNTSSIYGGGLYSEGEFEINESSFEANEAVDGGGLYTLGAASSTLNTTQFLDNEATDDGGAVLVNGSFLVAQSNYFEGNLAANYGGAFYSVYSYTEHDQEVYFSNEAQAGGAMSSWGGDYLISNAFYDANSAASGGAIYNDSRGGYIEMNQASFTENVASSHGGAIFNSSSLELRDVSFDANSADLYGGALRNTDTLLGESLLFTNNLANQGGALHTASAAGDSYLVDVTMSNNSAEQYGGAVYVASDAITSLDSCEISSNSTTMISGSHAGGALYNAGELDVYDCNLDSNSSKHGGAVYMSSSSSSYFISSHLSNNSSSSDGGAFYVYGELYLDEVQVDQNTAGKGGGGLLIYDAIAEIKNSSITSNDAAYDAGGVHVIMYSTLSLDNVTISENTSTSGSGGMKISGVVDAAHVTIADNVSGTASNDVAGGITMNGSGTLSIKNSLLSGNTAKTAMDCYGAITSGGYNFISDSSACGSFSSVTTDQIDVDPLLESLASNGGSTLTQLLQSGTTVSPAIDVIPSTYCTNTSGVALTEDQRGLSYVRPVDFLGSGAVYCDAGAVELQ